MSVWSDLTLATRPTDPGTGIALYGGYACVSTPHPRWNVQSR
jgi:hypothetical protein